MKHKYTWFQKWKRVSLTTLKKKKKLKNAVIPHSLECFIHIHSENPEKCPQVPKSMKTNIKHIVNILLTISYERISRKILILSRIF